MRLTRLSTPNSTFLKNILRSVIFMCISMLSNGLAMAADTKSDHIPITQETLAVTDMGKLVDLALNEGVSPEKVDNIIDKLFDEKKPDVVPEELPIKKELYDLILAHRNARGKLKEAHQNICRVVLKSKSNVDYVTKEFRAPMTRNDRKIYEKYLKELQVYAKNLLKALDKVSQNKLSPPMPQLPPEPEYRNTAYETFSKLGTHKKNALHAKLRKKSMKTFSCKGTCSKRKKCSKDIIISSSGGVAEGNNPEMFYKISAIPSCKCSKGR